MFLTFKSSERKSPAIIELASRLFVSGFVETREEETTREPGSGDFFIKKT